MFVRHVTLRLKRDAVKDFNRIAENEILPTLRRQHGFRDEIVLVAPKRLEAVAISFWDTQEAADAFDKVTYPNVVKSLTSLIEGTPSVETFELSLSTLQKAAAKG